MSTFTSLHKWVVDEQPILPSFDVTKVPIEETIDIMYIVHKTFKNATLFHSSSFSEFHKRLRLLSVKNVHF